MTRSKLWQRVETGLIVTLISVLVWLYAEGENVQAHNNERVRVAFVAEGGQELAIDPQETEILASFRASTGEMSWLADRLRRGPLEIPIRPPQDSASPVQTLVLRDALQRSAIGSLGINILDTNPVTMSVRVEPLVTRRVKVVAPPIDVQFAEPPTFVPDELTVTLPRSVADAAAIAPLVARMDLLDLSAYDTNTDTSATVTVEPASELRTPWTRLSQPTVQVRFNIRKLTDTVRLPNIPIRIAADPLTLQEYDIGLSASDLVVRDVRFTGAADEIEQIATGATRVWAELRLTREQIERAASTNAPVMVTPTVIAPEGVAAEVPEPIPVTIRRR
jgi:hypothetical protein